jgi:hypothetical protein
MRIPLSAYTYFTGALLIALAPALHANTVLRRATIVGGGDYGGGKCTLQVNVDHAAEVEIWGDSAELRTLAGQSANWRRFECTAPMPRSAADLRLISLGGRGPTRLIQDPRYNRGRALVRIDDPKAGRGLYTFALQWRGWGGPPPGGPGWNPGPPGPPPGPPGTGYPPANAIEACHAAVEDRLHQYGYSTVTFGRMAPRNNPGRPDWITGTVTGERKSRGVAFSYSCAVDFRSGRVRSVDVQRQ